MVGTLWTGISGLAGSQTALDNESNNIANVNTIGYKSARISFTDQMYQEKIGKGVTSFDVEKMYTQGSLKRTGVSYDMALSGDGFFVSSNGRETFYTRAGNFRMGESGTLEDVGANKIQGWAMQPLKSDDIISGLLSFNLDYGLNQIFCTLYKRATLALHRLILPDDFFNHIIDDNVTILPLMPINITQIFDKEIDTRVPSPELLDKVRCITSSGGNVTKTMIEDCKRTFVNAKFYSMHGLTEAFRSTYLDPSQIEIRPDSIGKAIPDVELYVINEDGKECKVREVGELIHRGGYIYRGFWNAPEQNEKRFKSIQILKDVINIEGQLTDEIVVASGDYVYKDEEGYLYFVSRRDDMIKTRGFRVSPYEIESVISKKLPQIEASAVFSIENEQIEEEIVLVYSAKTELSSNEIVFELKKHLASYMIPSKIIYKKSLPLVQSDKNRINKEELKKEFLEG
jgi:acyl-coenzyme A synthetase/AMP-(fatty) acid ligase